MRGIQWFYYIIKVTVNVGDSKTSRRGPHATGVTVGCHTYTYKCIHVSTHNYGAMRVVYAVQLMGREKGGGAEQGRIAPETAHPVSTSSVPS